jgi:hypothetical protein
MEGRRSFLGNPRTALLQRRLWFSIILTNIPLTSVHPEELKKITTITTKIHIPVECLHPMALAFHRYSQTIELRTNGWHLGSDSIRFGAITTTDIDCTIGKMGIFSRCKLLGQVETGKSMLRN